MGVFELRARIIISSPAARMLTTAAPIQSTRYGPIWASGSGIVTDWMNAARTAMPPEKATGIAR